MSQDDLKTILSFVEENRKQFEEIVKSGIISFPPEYSKRCGRIAAFLLQIRHHLKSYFSIEKTKSLFDIFEEVLSKKNPQIYLQDFNEDIWKFICDELRSLRKRYPEIPNNLIACIVRYVESGEKIYDHYHPSQVEVKFCLGRTRQVIIDGVSHSAENGDVLIFGPLHHEVIEDIPGLDPTINIVCYLGFQNEGIRLNE